MTWDIASAAGVAIFEPSASHVGVLFVDHNFIVCEVEFQCADQVDPTRSCSNADYPDRSCRPERLFSNCVGNLGMLEVDGRNIAIKRFPVSTVGIDSHCEDWTVNVLAVRGGEEAESARSRVLAGKLRELVLGFGKRNLYHCLLTEREAKRIDKLSPREGGKETD